MSESANPQFNPNTGMRAQGEADRSPEYKEARDAFVQRVNEFLGSMKALQEQGGMVEIPGGMTLPIVTEARMTATFLGINNRGFRSFANHEQGGISLTGDGEFSPLELQALLPNTGKEALRIKMRGTNPLLPKDESGVYKRSSRSDGDFARLEITRTVTTDDGVFDQSEEFAVLGDGSAHGPDLSGIDERLPYEARVVRAMELGRAVVDQLAAETLVPIPGEGQ